mgnify:CR=1 FL=1
MSGGGGPVPVSVTAAFDAGNIECLNADDCTTGLGVQVKIKDDPCTELEGKAHKQWFYFRAAGSFRHVKSQFTIINAGDVSYPEAWPKSTVVYSYDRKEWKRCHATTWSESTGHLTWSLTPEANVVWFAFFAPYSFERHSDLVAMCSSSSDAKVEQLGNTLDGRAIDLVVAGSGPLKCWVIHRQHPGETQAEWFAEGLLERLLAPAWQRDGASARERGPLLLSAGADGCVRAYELPLRADGQATLMGVYLAFDGMDILDSSEIKAFAPDER